MADQSYTVSTHAEGASSRLASSLRGMALAGAAIGAGATIAGVAMLSHAVTGLQADVEDTQISIAGMAQAGGAVGNWNEAWAFAAQQMQQIRRDAAALPGTAEQYLQVYRDALPAALEAGMDPAAVAPLTNSITAVMTTMGQSAQVVGRELAMMMQGHVTEQMPVWRAIRGQVHMTSAEWRSATDARRIAALQSVYNTTTGPYAAMLRRAATSWSAIAGASADNLRTVRQIATAPLFEAAKGTLSDINDWFERNKTYLTEVMRGVGESLAYGFERARTKIEEIVAALRQVSHAEWLGRLVDGLQRVGGGIVAAGRMAVNTARVNPGAAATVGGAAVGAMVGAPGLGLAAGAVFAMLREHGAELVPVWDNLAAIGRDLQGVLMPVVRMFETIESTLGDFAAGALPGLSAGLREIVEGFRRGYSAFSDSITGLLANIRPEIHRLGAAFGELWHTATSVLGPALAFVGRGIGEIVTSFAAILIPAIHALASALHWASYVARHPIEAMRNGVPELAIPRGASRGPARDVGAEVSAAFEGLRSPEQDLHDLVTATNRHRLRRPREPASPGHTNVTVRIEQTINDASDPARVLVDTRRAIWSALFHPIEGAGAPVLR